MSFIASNCSFPPLCLPDKQHEKGCVERFKKISAAYEVLSDPDRKRAYDAHGEDENGASAPPAADIFSMFFGGGHGRPQRGENIVHPLSISLEELFRGKTFKLAINRNVICTVCDGVGGPRDALSTCPGCQGTGSQSSYRQIGPGMMQQMKSQCGICKGDGKIIDGTKKCTECKGQKVVKEQKILEVVVPPGTEDNHRFVFNGASDCAPGMPPGDVVFVLQTKQHPFMQRKEDDLLMERCIGITESLCGFDLTVPNIDGSQLRLRSEPGSVTKPGDMFMVEQAGMASKGKRGRLFIKFKVEFPDTIPDAADLKRYLPPVGPVQSNEPPRRMVRVQVANAQGGDGRAEGSCAQM